MSQSQKWRAAARIYRELAEEKALNVVHSQQTVKVQEDTWRLQLAQIVSAAPELEAFLNSGDGQDAIELLRVAKRHIIFGEESEGGFADVAFIDGNGLGRSIEPSGMWLAYTAKKDIPTPVISKITAREAIQAAVFYRKKRPDEVIAWLRDELDKIADAAEWVASHTT